MRRSIVFTSVFILSAAFSAISHAATLGSPTDVSFKADYDGSTQYYSQLLPTDFVSTKTYDIIIALHGSGSTRTQYATFTRDECRATRDVTANHDMILICPDYRASTSWMGPAAEADMLQIITSLKTKYKVGKIIMTGGSMGGTGSLTFTALHPNLIAGVCSVNGLANFVGYTNFSDQIAASFGTTEAEVAAQRVYRSASNYPQAFTMPMSITAGGLDTSVPPDSVRSLYDTVRNTNPKNAKTMKFYRPATGHSTNYVDNAVALEYVVRQAKSIDTDLNPITINTSFEYQTLTAGSKISGVVDGWTSSSTNSGVTRLTDEDFAAKFDNSMLDGNQMAVAKNSALYQFLGTKVRPGIYHLSFTAASPKDNSAIGKLLAGFMVADNNIASASALAWGDSSSYTANPGFVAGKWTEISVDWVVLSDSPSIGKDLYINFYANSANAVYFDNVNVTFTHAPEPTTLSMSVAGLIGFITYACWKQK